MDRGKRIMVETDRPEQLLSPRRTRSGILIREPSEYPRQTEHEPPRVEEPTEQPRQSEPESQSGGVHAQGPERRRPGRPPRARRGATSSAGRRVQFGAQVEGPQRPPQTDQVQSGPEEETRATAGPSGVAAVAAPTVESVSSQQMMDVMHMLTGILQEIREQNRQRSSVDPSPSTVPIGQTVDPSSSAVPASRSSDPSPSPAPVGQAQTPEVHVAQTETVDVEAREGARREEHRVNLGLLQGSSPPFYGGTAHSRPAERWIAELEKLFRFHGCSELVRVRYASYLLVGEAEAWWRGIADILPGQGDELTWAEFVKMFYEQFFPASERDRRAEEFARLEQGKMSVAEYEAKFRELSRFVSWVALDPREKAKKFVRGLRPSLRRWVTLSRLET